MNESNSATTAYDVAILGCGLMGAALVRALAKNGRSVAVWNRTPDRAEALAGDGITPIRTVGDAVDSSRLIIACMSTYESTISALESVADWTGVTLVNVASGAPERPKSWRDGPRSAARNILTGPSFVTRGASAPPTGRSFTRVPSPAGQSTGRS